VSELTIVSYERERVKFIAEAFQIQGG